MKSTIAILKQNNWKETTKVNLSKLGTAFMFPISFLAFISIITGITYTLPRHLLITELIGNITSIIFYAFPILVYFSIINTFHKDKNKNTFLNATIFISAFIITQGIIRFIPFIPNHISSISIFSILMLSSIFIKFDKFTFNPSIHFLISFVISLIILPFIIIVSLLILGIGKLVGMLPFGINAFFYGFSNRILNSIGLHSLLIPIFNYSSIGGTLELVDSSGNLFSTINGDSAIWRFLYENDMSLQDLSGIVEIGSKTLTYKITNTNSIGQYQQGFLPMINIAYPMIAISYLLVNGMTEKSKLLLTGALMSMMSGITESFEFIFIFVSPILFLLNAVMVGVSFMALNLLGVSNWISTGWFVDIILFGIIPTMSGFTTNWHWIPIVGLSIGTIYSILFVLITNRYSIV